MQENGMAFQGGRGLPKKTAGPSSTIQGTGSEQEWETGQRVWKSQATAGHVGFHAHEWKDVPGKSCLVGLHG